MLLQFICKHYKPRLFLTDTISKPKAKKSLDFNGSICQKTGNDSCSSEPLQNNSFVSQNEEKDLSVREEESSTNVLTEVTSREDPVSLCINGHGRFLASFSHQETLLILE